MYPIVFDAPPFQLFGLTIDLPPIYSFGLMMATAFMVAAALTASELNRKGYDGEAASSLVVWAAIGGLVGARLWNIIEDWDKFSTDPFGSLFSGSGFTFFGGLFGGMIAVRYGMSRHNLPWGDTADAIAPTLAIAHAIGRVGCQLAGDGDWGRETNVPWGMAYPNAIIGWPHPPGVVVHPTPVYEMIAYTIVFAILWRVRKRDLPTGAMLWMYLAMAASARFAIEFVRVNPRLILGLSEAQIVSLVLVVLGLIRLTQLGVLMPTWQRRTA